MTTSCCTEATHSCFRKSGQRGSPYGYAACMPSCPQDGNWDCEVITLPPPSPPLGASTQSSSTSCSATFERCFETQCCQSVHDGCFRRAGRQFAMCKPLQSYTVSGACVSDDTWVCPGWEPASPDPPAPLPPPRPPAAPSAESLAPDIQDAYPSEFAGSTAASPKRLDTKLLLAFAIAGIVLCCVGTCLVVSTCVMMRGTSARAAGGTRAADMGESPHPLGSRKVKTKRVKGTLKAKYTRQISAADDDLEDEDDEDGEGDEDDEVTSPSKARGAAASPVADIVVDDVAEVRVHRVIID